jgi:hypothetical protein
MANQLAALKKEIRNQVKDAIDNRQHIDIGSTHLDVVDCGNDQIYVAGFGRASAKSYDLVRSVTAEVLSQVKSEYRDAGPQAALDAIRS